MSSTVTEIKDELQTILNNSTWWQRFIGSQFVAYLSLFVAQVVQRCSAAAERNLQDSFLSLATRRAAILAGAENKGYVVAKAMPSTGTATVENKTSSRITLPSYTQCYATNQVIYAITEAIDIAAGETTTLPVAQIEIVSLEYEIETEESWLSLLIDSDYSDSIHKIVVYVDGELWESSFKFRNTGSDSKVYMEYYKSTDQYGVKFGNGSNGMMPPAGSTVTIELWLTDGDTILLDGQSLTLSEDQDLSVDVSDLAITTATQVTGGEAVEDIESVRDNALYYESYDEQIAWDGDYTAYIKSRMSNIVWLSVWGEEEQEKLKGTPDLANINTIFIAAYADGVDESDLGDQIIALFDEREGYNEKYQKVTRTDAPFTVNVTGYVYDSSNPSDAEQAVYDALSAAFGMDVKDKGNIYIKNVWAAIEAITSDEGIDAFEVDATGILSDIPIDTYQYLDLENSTISFAYRT